LLKYSTGSYVSLNILLIITDDEAQTWLTQKTRTTHWSCGMHLPANPTICAEIHWHPATGIYNKHDDNNSWNWH